MEKKEFDEIDIRRLWKAVERAATPIQHPGKTAECLSLFQFEKRRYTFEQLVHIASCSYCKKTDWMFHRTPLTFKFLALLSPTKRIIQQIGNTITEIYPKQPWEQFIYIPDVLLQQERSLLGKKINVKYLIQSGTSTQRSNFLQLTPHLFASGCLLVFLEVDLQNNRFDVILELRKCEVHHQEYEIYYQVGNGIPNCYVIFQKAQEPIADIQTSEYGACGIYGLSAGTYQVTFDKYPHISLELELLRENITKSAPKIQ